MILGVARKFILDVHGINPPNATSIPISTMAVTAKSLISWVVVMLPLSAWVSSPDFWTGDTREDTF